MLKRLIQKYIDELLDRDARNIPRELKRRSLVETCEFVEKYMISVQSFRGRKELLAYAIKNVQINNGLWLEFGVYKGNTINFIARQTKSKVEEATEIEELVRKDQYKQAVFTAKRERDKLIKIGDKDNPDFQLKLGEIDVWYAHALMYTGAIEQALATLNDLITRLKDQNLLYQQVDHGLLRWNRVLGRAHNHVGYVNWMVLGHLEVALERFSAAIPYFLAGNLKEELATAYDNMGRVYTQMGYRIPAELLIGQGYQLRKDLPNKYREGLSLTSRAIFYLTYGHPSQALTCSEAALAIFRQEAGDKKESGERGIGLALITKARALRYIVTAWEGIGKREEAGLEKAIEALKEADRIFQEVEEEVRRFEVYNELGCIYREMVALDQGADTRNLIKATDYLKDSLSIAKGAEKERIKYPALYVDTCEDLARTHWSSHGPDSFDKAYAWIKAAEKAVPDEYKFRKDIDFPFIPPTDCIEEFWQQLGKTRMLCGEMRFFKNRTLLEEAVEDYILAASYFGRYLERPLDSRNEHLYPKAPSPQLANHNIFIRQIYEAFDSLAVDDLRRIKHEVLPELKNSYSLKSAWLKGFYDNTLGLLLQIKSSEYGMEEH